MTETESFIRSTSIRSMQMQQQAMVIKMEENEKKKKEIAAAEQKVIQQKEKRELINKELQACSNTEAGLKDQIDELQQQLEELVIQRNNEIHALEQEIRKQDLKYDLQEEKNQITLSKERSAQPNRFFSKLTIDNGTKLEVVFDEEFTLKNFHESLDQNIATIHGYLEKDNISHAFRKVIDLQKPYNQRYIATQGNRIIVIYK